MTQKIFRYNATTYGFVSDHNIQNSEEVVIDTVKGKDVTANVTAVLEQRPERGVYSDESRRRIWQKIQVQPR